MRGETHVEAVLGVEQRVHLLQVRHGLELRHPVIVEGHAVVHGGVDVEIHHPRHHRVARAVDQLRARRRFERAFRADPGNAVALDQHHRVLHRLAAAAVDQGAAADRL
jgi:hypothetical protein